MKTCTKCGAEKPRTEFYRSSKSPDGLIARCKACMDEYARRPEVKLRAKIRRETPGSRVRETIRKYRSRPEVKERLRQTEIARKYGLTREKFQSMLEEQDGKCAICSGKLVFSGKTGMHVDHCHETNIVRGLLCAKCNIGLGCFNDSPELLRRAAGYTEERKV